MKDGVGVVQFGTNDCTAESFRYVLSKSWPYVTERAQVSIHRGSIAYCVDMILENKMLVKSCSKKFYFFRKLYRGASNVDMCERVDREQSLLRCRREPRPFYLGWKPDHYEQREQYKAVYSGAKQQSIYKILFVSLPLSLESIEVHKVNKLQIDPTFQR